MPRHLADPTLLCPFACLTCLLANCVWELGRLLWGPKCAFGPDCEEAALWAHSGSLLSVVLRPWCGCGFCHLSVTVSIAFYCTTHHTSLWNILSLSACCSHHSPTSDQQRSCQWRDRSKKSGLRTLGHQSLSWEEHWAVPQWVPGAREWQSVLALQVMTGSYFCCFFL